MVTEPSAPSPSVETLEAVEVEVEALARLAIVVSRLSRRFRVAAADQGLTPSQLSVLATIVRHGPIGMAAIAEREGVNPTLLSRIVGALDRAALVTRWPGAQDRRCILVDATPSGRRLQMRVRAQRIAALRDGLSALGPQQVDELLQALPALERLAGVPRDGGSA